MEEPRFPHVGYAGALRPLRQFTIPGLPMRPEPEYLPVPLQDWQREPPIMSGHMPPTVLEQPTAMKFLSGH